MLSAFTARPLVELRPRDKSKIESILTYGDRLLVGLNTGSLRVYRVNEISDEQDGDHGGEEQTQEQEQSRQTENAENAESAPPASNIKPTDLLREQEKFSRYKIEQLAIIKEANILVSLSNGHVSIHDLQTYELQEQLTKTRGASAFAVTSNIVKDPVTGVPSIVSRLAVAVKRKLLLWTWQDMELDDGTKEITLISGIKTLTWANGVKIVAGLSSSYVVVNVDTEEVVDIVGPGSIGGAGGQETGRLGGVGVGMSYLGMGGVVPKPLATRLGEGEMLLAKDVNTHFIDTEGNALGRRQILWNTAPEALGYSYPYLLALQDPSKGTLEVRNPETLSLLQSISLPSASMMHIPQPTISLAHAGKGFLVASDRIIWRMEALGYDSQIDSLVEEGHLDEAISLISMLEDALLKDKAGRLREAKLQKAQILFDQRRYRDSLDLFTEVSAPPELVIRLYPKLIAGSLSTVVEEEKPQEAQDEAEDQSSQKSNGSKTNGVEPGVEDKGKAKAVGYAPSVRSFLRAKSDDASEAGSLRGKLPEGKAIDKPLEGKDLRSAVHCLQGFLADIRRRLQRFLNPDGTLKESALHTDGEIDEFTQSVMYVLGIPPDDRDTDFGARLRETATLVDTTLFRAHMFATPSLAGSLFRITNFCDPEVVMEKLEETARYNDLIDFLFGKRLHRPALERLRKFGEADTREGGEEQEEEGSAPPPQLQGPKRTVAYLQHLPPEMIDLILEFAEWPVRVDPELGMEIFLADTENAETLPRDRVLEFLQSIDPKLAIRYLEHVIEELNDMTPDLHQRLLSLYLDRLRSRESDEKEFASEREWKECKDKFLDMLKSSEQYSPARMLDKLPRDVDPEFFEARAIIFSKMGQHRQALEIYVFKLQDPEKAEEYCNQIHLSQDTLVAESEPGRRIAPIDREEGGQQLSIYHTLLSLYLSPPHHYKPQYGPAIEILAKHGSRLPANSTLDLIPEKFPVRELEFYFRGRIRAETTIVNEGRIIAGLRKVQNITTQTELHLGDGALGGNRGRNRFVTVSEERVCGVCHKRLGGSVISVFPNNTVIHLGCANRRGGIGA
ncbi:hypothetical protein AJ80_05810 [Polytolypa hystricis UAMH7299]|uniref:CNH domain-containing protein n=1 Tax=Polytolypa hystricis (strain UAMH7299) TaxID=1447883 RepID=A0A2B7XZW7_POLH7|nr:hypothetical protein AJ80_05810 [Polytolypa hystricis UAMH7299]